MQKFLVSGHGSRLFGLKALVGLAVVAAPAVMAAPQLIDLGAGLQSTLNTSGIGTKIGDIAVNNSGQVAGTLSIGALPRGVYMTAADGYTRHAIPFYAADALTVRPTQAWDISNNGLVALYEQYGAYGVALTYSIGSAAPVRAGAGNGSSQAGVIEIPYALNDLGTAVGAKETSSSLAQAAAFSGGSTIDLGQVPGKATIALAANSSGTAVGWAYSNLQDHAFVYTTAGGVADLGDVFGWSHAWATSINDAGTVAGTAYDPTAKA